MEETHKAILGTQRRGRFQDYLYRLRIGEYNKVQCEIFLHILLECRIL
jgi:hypothetical protein